MRTTTTTILPLVFGRATLPPRARTTLPPSARTTAPPRARTTAPPMARTTAPPASADVLVDESGQVLDVRRFCGAAETSEIGARAVDSASAGSDMAPLLDDLDDGTDVTGVTSEIVCGNLR
jgi:hypothetical protein